MTAYVVLLLVAVVLAWFSGKLRGEHKGEALGIRGIGSTPKWNVFDIAIVAWLSLFAGFRDRIGTDYVNYAYLFDGLDPAQAWGSQINNSAHEPGFTVLILLIRSMGFDTRGVFFVVSLITVYLVYSVLRRRSASLSMSILLYVALGSYLDQFNVTRQALAIALCFFGATLLSKRYLWAITFLLMGVSVHYSAAIFVVTILCVWMVRRSFGLASIIVSGMGVAVALSLYLPGTREMISAVDENYADYLSDGRQAGLGYILILCVYIATIAVLLLGGAQKTEPVLVLIVFAGVVMMVIGLQSVVVGRIASFFTIFLALAWPNGLATFKFRILFQFATILMAAGYFYLSLHSYGGLIPYQSILGGRY